MGDFQKLKVWNESMDLVIKIYELTGTGSFVTDFALRDQIRKAAISVPSNIAEGDELGSNKQSVRHFLIAKGSIAEVITQVIIAKRISYLNEQQAEEMVEKYKKISSMLYRLIKARRT